MTHSQQPTPSEVSTADMWLAPEVMQQKTSALAGKIVKAVLSGEIPPPDRIALIPRGGLYVVDVLARRLALSGDKVLMLGISRYDRNHPTHGGAFKYGQMLQQSDVEGYNVLLAEEVHDTGMTTAEGVRILNGLGALSVTTCAVQVKPLEGKEVPPPDYYVEETLGWAHYPTEQLDELGDLYEQVLIARGLRKDPYDEQYVAGRFLE